MLQRPECGSSSQYRSRRSGAVRVWRPASSSASVFDIYQYASKFRSVCTHTSSHWNECIIIFSFSSCPKSNMAADSGMDTCPSPEIADSRKRPLDGDTDDTDTKRSHFSTGESIYCYYTFCYITGSFKILFNYM